MIPKPLSLTTEEVRDLLERGACEVRRLVTESSRGRIRETASGLLVYATGAPDDNGEPIDCPFGAPGSAFWVREPWGVGTRSHPEEGSYDGIEYKADEFYLESSSDELPLHRVELPEGVCLGDYGPGWRSRTTMPRWASRLTCETESVAHAMLDGVHRWVATLKRIKQ